MSKILPAIVVAAVALAGCAAKGEPEFGSSARHMVEGQRYDPGAPRDTVGAVDGQKAAKAIEGYRTEKKTQGKSQSSAILVPTTQ